VAQINGSRCPVVETKGHPKTIQGPCVGDFHVGRILGFFRRVETRATANDPKLSDGGVRRGTYTMGGKAAVEVPACRDDGRKRGRSRYFTLTRRREGVGRPFRATVGTI